MFDAPVDAWYVWVAASLVSVGLVGIALELPSSPPPDADAAAAAVDRVAASEYDASVTYEHDADEVRLGAKHLSFRNDGGTARASVAFGEMTPVGGDPRLRAVLHGDRPSTHFYHWTHFEFVARGERGEPAEWRSSDGQLTARTVTWGGARVTLVDA